MMDTKLTIEYQYIAAGLNGMVTLKPGTYAVTYLSSGVKLQNEAEKWECIISYTDYYKLTPQLQVVR